MSKPDLIITDKAREKLRISELIDTRTFDAHRSLITDKWIKLYALAIRDSNPLWFDDAYAAREGRFGERVLPTAYFTLFNPMENGGACPASDFWAELHGKPGKYWGGHAAYNKIDSQKSLRIYPDFGHEGLPGNSDAVLQFMMRL